MPEGDSVHRLATRLQPLVGRAVLFSQFRVPALSTADLTGGVVTSVRAHGKHLLVAVTMPDGRSWTLHTHLRMEGTWRVHPVGTRWGLPAHTARVVLQVSGTGPDSTPPAVELVGHDLGEVDLWPTDEVPTRLARLGPDILDEDWPDHGRAVALRRAVTDPSRAVSVVLLDQRVLAGVGNELCAETCFLSGVNPASPVGRVDMERVIDTAASLAATSMANPWRTSTGNLRRGRTTWVFGRNHRPCRRCGTMIRSAALGSPDRPGEERIIWWCPHCQPPV